MCLAIPYKVIFQDKNKIKLDFFGKKRVVKKSLIKTKPGDFVLLQNGVIIKKVPKKQAEEILNLLKH